MSQNTSHSTRAKRIAIVASYAPSLINFRGELIREIISRGHKVLCLAPQFDDKTKEELTHLGADWEEIKLSRTGINPIADLKTISELKQKFTRCKPDIVMGYTPKPAIYSTLAAKSSKVPHIVPMITGLGYAFLEGKGAKLWFIRQAMKALYSLALARADGVIFHNEDDHRHLKSYGVIPEKLTVHIVNGSGVNLNHFDKQPIPATNAEMNFLMIARLVRYKGVAEYCEAAKLIRLDFPNARFILAGPEEKGPAGYPIEELRKYDSDVEYIGEVTDVRQLLGKCHVYILPSYGEGMPRTVLEAMATGRPIITSDTRGCRETVRHSTNGYLVPIGDSKSLAQVIRSFIKEPEQIIAMGNKSREFAEKKFDIAIINNQMIQILAL